MDIDNVSKSSSIEQPGQEDTKCANQVSQEPASTDDTALDPYQEFDIPKDVIHMDVVEEEKLAWMKEPPKPVWKDKVWKPILHFIFFWIP